MPPEIAKIATTHMALPVRIEVAPQGTAAKNVEQEIFIIRKEDKIRLLQKILKEYTGTILIFSRTKHGAKKITQNIQKFGYTAAEIHSNKSLAQRIKALDGFKTGKFRVLVATDIAARGIDVKNIELVVNFDLPDNSEDYVHRIGRTGRAGTSGKAISFATPDQRGDIQSIERLIKKTLPISKIPNDLPPAPVETMRTFSNTPNTGNNNYRHRGFQKKNQKSQPQTGTSRPPKRKW
jgi:ATP-dependent RNA helicase RhlE